MSVAATINHIEQRAALQNMERALLVAIRSALGGLQIEAVADQTEAAIETSGRETTARQVEALRARLIGARSALKKLASGAYGECESCGDDIAPKRLKAVPEALYCLRCAEMMEREVAA